MKEKWICEQCNWSNPAENKCCGNCGASRKSDMEEQNQEISNEPKVSKELSNEADSVETKNDMNEETKDNVEVIAIDNREIKRELSIDENNNQPVQKKKDNKKMIIIIVLCIIAVAVLIFVIFSVKNHASNISAAKNVTELINDIGDNYSSITTEPKVTQARKAYDALNEKQKTYVSNLNNLNDAEKAIEQKKADEKLVSLATTLKSAAELCQDCFHQYKVAWYNYIYEKKDEYNNGDFSDMDKTLEAVSESDLYVSRLNKLNTWNKTIVNILSELKQTPPSDTVAYDAAKNVYVAYQPMYEMATYPKGSYNTYTSDVQNLNSTYQTAYAALLSTMPSLASTQ